MSTWIGKDEGLSIPSWLVWLVAVGFIFGGLGSFGILDNNEGLYAEIPREMLASHDWRLWVIPHLNGLPYMEKPPLLYWLTALSFALFGESEWSARLVPALSAFGCVVLLVWFGKAVKRPLAGRVAAIMFASCVGVMAMSHVLMFDMLLTVLVTAALMHAWRYIAEGDVRHVRRAYAFLAFALLAKGLVALVLFGLVIAVFSVLNASSLAGFARSVTKWFEPWALAVFLAIAAPWHIVASMIEPIFAWFYFMNEHVLRFLGKREPHDYYAGAWWYYLPRMVIYLFPWSLLLLGMATRRAAQSGWQDAGLKRFLWTAWLLPLLFFSISSAKANYYLIAVMPFAAFHLALALEDREYLSRFGRAAPALAIAVLSTVALAAASRRLDAVASAVMWGLSQRTFLLSVFGAAIVLSLGTVIMIWRGNRAGEAGYLILAALIAFVLSATLPVLEPTISTRQIAQYLQRELPKYDVYLYRNFEEQSSLPFYLKTPLPVIDARSNDLFWGNKLRKNDIIISSGQFMQRVTGHQVAVVVMDRQLKDFRESGFFGIFKGEKHIGNSTVFFN
jgi:4-amino-4-deoxy-L-arabinose transferase-like glycosyltransferase